MGKLRECAESEMRAPRRVAHADEPPREGGNDREAPARERNFAERRPFRAVVAGPDEIHAQHAAQEFARGDARRRRRFSDDEDGVPARFDDAGFAEPRRGENAEPSREPRGADVNARRHVGERTRIFDFRLDGNFRLRAGDARKPFRDVERGADFAGFRAVRREVNFREDAPVPREETFPRRLDFERVDLFRAGQILRGNVVFRRESRFGERGDGSEKERGGGQRGKNPRRSREEAQKDEAGFHFSSESPLTDFGMTKTFRLPFGMMICGRATCAGTPPPAASAASPVISCFFSRSKTKRSFPG